MVVADDGDVKVPELGLRNWGLKPGESIVWEVISPSELSLRREAPCEEPAGEGS
jgi:hypothetical protein